MAKNPISAAGDAVSNTVNAGTGLVGSIWGAFRKVAPVLLASTVIAAATGGLSIPLDAANVAAAGTSVAGMPAVPVDLSSIGSFTYQGLVHNLHGIGDGLEWALSHVPT
ncbi:MAG: hypothetical protein KDI90_11575 [Alphaproteobacteria bacterium]|nr:hypothetical protein [Alphaproteobacteria bacterium]MCB9975546.1 hypothetical protein [Rhodospirillales bacterium]